MAKYKSIVTTEAGLSLLENAAYIGGAIQFVALKTGNGAYDGTEDLSKLTDLKNVRQTFGVAGVSKKGLDIVIRAVIDNDDVTEGYYITEIGLYAKNPNTEESVLYAVIIAEDGNEDYLPSYSATPTRITLEMNVGITESEESVTFAAPSLEGVYVPVQDFEEHTSKAENPHGVTAKQVGLGNVPNVSTNDQTPTYTEASTLAALTSGEKLSVAFGKIAKAVSNLISHLADSVKHITAAERTAWNAKLDKTATAADSDKLDGHDSVYFATATSVANITNGTTTVGKATKATQDADGNNIASTYATNKKVEQILAGIEDGTTATGNAAALGGETAVEWQAKIDDIIDGTTPVAKATNASSLGDETASAWQTKIDSIQTTSRATLSSAGWYRVAEYKGGSSGQANGALTNPCKLFIGVTMDGSAEIQLDSKNNARELYALNVFGLTKITKVRYTTSGNNAYLEIYASASCSAIFKIFNGESYECKWATITPTLTEETVSGVTVTTTYDIPANASPYTTADIEALRKWVGAGKEVTDCNTLTVGSMGYCYPNATNAPFSNASAIIFTYGVSESYKTQFAISNGRRIKARNSIENVWSAWSDENVTTSDLTTALAGYFPLSGGTIEGTGGAVPLSISRPNQDYIEIGFKGPSGYTGYLGFSDINKPVFENADRSRVYNLLHSGNYTDYAVPKTGGTIENNSYTLTLKRTSTDSSPYLTFENGSGVINRLSTKPDTTEFVRCVGSNMHTMLDKGNSTGIKFTEDDTTAPSSDMLWAHL